MSVDIEMLGIALDTSGLKSGQAELRRTADAANRAADSLDAAGRRGSDGMDKVEKGAGRARVGVEGLAGVVGSLRSVMGALAIAATIREFTQMADTFTGLESRMKAVITSVQGMVAVNRELLQIADQNRANFIATATLYTKLAKPIADLGGGMRETLDITRAFSSAMLVGGATATEAAAATLQFAQAMGSGVLRGDEFNSIAEASPRLLQAIADGAGVARGALRGMAENGMLNASLVSGALLKQMIQLEAEAVAYGATVGGSMTQVGNAIGAQVAEVNKATGATNMLAGGIRSLVPVVQAVGQGIVSLTGFLGEHGVVLATIVGGYVGFRSALAISAIVSEVSAAVSVATTAYMASTASLYGLSGAFAAARVAAIGFLTSIGPVGWAMAGLGAAAAGFLAWSQSQKAVADSSELGAKAIADLQDRIKAIDAGPAAQKTLQRKSAIDQLVESYRSQGVTENELIRIRELATQADEKAVAAGDKLLKQSEQQQEAAKRAADAKKAAQKAVSEQQQIEKTLAGMGADLAALNMSPIEKDVQKLALARVELQKLHPSTEQLAAFDSLAAKLNAASSAKAEFNKQSAFDDKYLEAAGIPSSITALLNDKNATVGDFQKQNGIDAITSSTEAAKKAAEEAKNSFDAFMGMDVGGLGAGFDKVTQSMSALTTQFGKLIEASDKYDEARIKNADDPIKLARLETQYQAIQIRSYGNLTGAAKNFFKEGTTGYKAMEAAEKAFRIAELAMNAKSIAEKLLGITTVTAAKLTGDATQAASSKALSLSDIASSAAATSVKAVEAVVSSIKSLPFPANIAAGAATIGFLGALGVNLAGGGGGSAKIDPGNTGTGTVFGDSSAESKSIQNAIDLLADNSSIELRYSAAMLSSLKGIEANIGGLTNLLVRLPGVGDLAGSVGAGFKTSGYGSLVQNGYNALDKVFSAMSFGLTEGLFSGIGKFISGLFGTKTKITGQGLYAPSQQLSDILAGGFDLFNYVDVNTKKKTFGLTTSSKDSTITSDADALLERQFGQVFQGFNSAIRAAAGPLKVNLDVIDTRLSDFVVSIGKINLQGLSGEQIQERLQAVFGAAADGIAAAALPGLDDFQKVGEGYFETVTRVATGVEKSGYLLERLHVSAIKYADIALKQGDVGAEIVRQSLQVYEQATFGFTTGVSEIIGSLSGSADEISDTYRAMLSLRDGLSAVGKAAISLSVDMIRGAGGAEALQSGLDSYFSDYLSDAERAAELGKRMTREFSALGLSVPLGKDGFKALVQGIDVSTAAGQQLFGSVISLAGGFNDLQDALNSAAEAQNKLKDSLQQERFGGLLPEQQLSDLQARYDAAYATALVSSGDLLTKQADIMAGLLDPLLKQAALVYASGEQYQAIRDYTLRAGDAIVDRSAVPGFAAGGMFGGGLRLVSERGPELEVTGPARYWNANQTQNMLSGGGQSNAELRQQNALLREVIAELQTLVGIQSAGTKQVLDQLSQQTTHLEDMSDTARLEASA